MIISLGEGLIDFISQKGLDFSGFPGGSPFNTSIAIARQQVPGQYLGRLSTDLFGSRLMDHLQQNSVGTDLVIRSEDPSTMGFVQKQSDGSAKYAFYSNGAADRSWKTDELNKVKIPEEARIIHFGSISLSQEPSGTVLADFLLTRCSGLLLSFDPNIRPALVPDREVYMKRFEALCAASAIVKLSDEDLEWLYPGTPVEESVQKILNLGTTLIALTEGKAGARLITSAEDVRSPLFDLPVADTIGAGDTFHGALLSFLHNRSVFTKEALGAMDSSALKEMGDFANKAAGINCSRSGCNPPTAQEMETVTL